MGLGGDAGLHVPPGPWRLTSWEAGCLQAHKEKALVPLPDNAPGWAGRGTAPLVSGRSGPRQCHQSALTQMGRPANMCASPGQVAVATSRED